MLARQLSVGSRQVFEQQTDIRTFQGETPMIRPSTAGFWTFQTHTGQ